jgi:DNA primase
VQASNCARNRFPKNRPTSATVCVGSCTRRTFSTASAYRRTPHAQQYLAQRGLTAETIEAFELGYAPDGWDYLLRFLQRHDFRLEDAERAGLLKARDDGSGYYDRFRNRITFPIHDASGRVVAFGARTLGDEEPKYLNSPETPLFEKRHTFYGWHFARGEILRQKAALIVEGYLDLIMLSPIRLHA